MPEKLKKVSEEFWDAICHAGSNVTNCELCGRVHFVDDKLSDYERGELEKLYADNKANPDRTIFHPNDDAVFWGIIDGRRAVYDCPCGLARKYEDFIIDNRRQIMSYLVKRAESLEREAREESALAEKANKASERLG